MCSLDTANIPYRHATLVPLSTVEKCSLYHLPNGRMVAGCIVLSGFSRLFAGFDAVYLSTTKLRSATATDGSKILPGKTEVLVDSANAQAPYALYCLCRSIHEPGMKRVTGASVS